VGGLDAFTGGWGECAHRQGGPVIRSPNEKKNEGASLSIRRGRKGSSRLRVFYRTSPSKGRGIAASLSQKRREGGRKESSSRTQNQGGAKTPRYRVPSKNKLGPRRVLSRRSYRGAGSTGKNIKGSSTSPGNSRRRNTDPTVGAPEEKKQRKGCECGLRQKRGGTRGG